MTSEERREKRYQRRKAKREKLKAEKFKDCTFENVIDIDSLFKAYLQSRKTIRWKASVQRYGMSLIRNLIKTHKELKAEKNVTKGFIEFYICERGKTRHILAVFFYERIIQRSLCDNALVPILSNCLIYDNGASLKGKGISFARDRLKFHLRKYYLKNGNEGWILLIDFSKYFENIDHKRIKIILRKYIKDKRLLKLIFQFVDAFDENSGLGIGSQISQILAITYRNHLDHIIKQELHAKFYACYMDDSYIISNSYEYLVYCLSVIRKVCKEDGIIINEKKIKIEKLSKGFIYMKGRYFFTDTGKVVVKPCRDGITRQRRKLKKFRYMVDKKMMTIDAVKCSENSHIGTLRRDFNARKTVYNEIKLYHKLFGNEPLNNKEKKMFVLIDIKNRVEAFNPNDMSGNTGWVEILNEVTEPLRDENNSLIYKVEDGKAVAIPVEERGIPERPIPQPTEEERISAAEEAIEFLTELL